jgi:hypothetical protein
MLPCFGKTIKLSSLLVVFLIAQYRPLLGQAPSFSVNPLRIEMEVNPGAEKTVSFDIAAPTSSSAQAQAGRLILNLTDWTIKEDGNAVYDEPGTQANSASPWTTFSPSAVTIHTGQTQLVRITVKVPEKTSPGVYRTALFIQERPHAAPAKTEGGVLFMRIRYAFTLYVIVPPVSSHPMLTDVHVNSASQPFRFTYELNNSGTLHVRPIINWIIKHGPDAVAQVDSRGKHEATVLLPGATLREAFAINSTLMPGHYQVSVIVDFQDAQPLQAMTRDFDVPPAGTLKVE